MELTLHQAANLSIQNSLRRGSAEPYFATVVGPRFNVTVPNQVQRLIPRKASSLAQGTPEVY